MCSGCKLEDLQSDFKMMQHHVDGPAVTTTAEEASGLLKWEVWGLEWFTLHIGED